MIIFNHELLQKQREKKENYRCRKLYICTAIEKMYSWIHSSVKMLLNFNNNKMIKLKLSVRLQDTVNKSVTHKKVSFLRIKYYKHK